MIRAWDRESGDLVTRGRQFLHGAEGTAAGIYHRLRMFFGEYWLDIVDGTPWFQSVLGKTSRDAAEMALKQRILSAPGVIAITRFEMETDVRSRHITVDCTVLDINNEAVRVLFDEDII